MILANSHDLYLASLAILRELHRNFQQLTGINMTSHQALIIGASSDIAKEIIQQLLSKKQVKVTAITRKKNDLSKFFDNALNLIEIKDYHLSNIFHAISQLNQETPFSQVFICNGLLHNDHIQPEKKLEDFNEQAFQEIISANVITPMLWIQQLTPILSKGQTSKQSNNLLLTEECNKQKDNTCKITVFTARVGSITDNNLGGWYSYRTSKAALNMMLKTSAIELARRAKHIKLIAFHPGTTDTPLSKPFQKNVPNNKLFTPSFVANQLLTLVDKAPIDGQLSYIDWQGKVIPW